MATQGTMVFTTGEVAEICHVAPRTVAKWFDTGQLKGYRIPGSRDRRIPRESLVRFLRDNGMPLGELENIEADRILIVSTRPQVTAELTEQLHEAGFVVDSVADLFEAGAYAESKRPFCVVIDFSIGTATANAMSDRLRRMTEEMRLIGLLPDGDRSTRFDHPHFDDLFHSPFDIHLLKARIRSLATGAGHEK